MTPFWKLSGGGNDFVALAEPNPDTLTPERVRKWCRRGLSVGADGVFVLRREAPGRIRMDHFNPDGRAASLCLNGTRCAARLALHLGWASEEAQLVTGAGIVQARDAGNDGIHLELAPPDSPPQPMTLKVAGQTHDGWWTKVGVPHLVLFRQEGLAEAPVETLGQELVHHPDLGPEGANINFVSTPSSSRLEIRTYERGVNGETLACGTGVLSSTLVALSEGLVKLPLKVLTAGGFELQVQGEMDGHHVRSWSLTGDARLIAEGSIHPGAEELPEAPRWTQGRVTAPAL